MKPRIKDLAVVLMLQLVLFLPFYTLDAYGLRISNVKVSKVTQNSATIEWQTDGNATSKVNFGKTKELGLSETDTDFVEKHNVTISRNLDSGTDYFFSVESKDKAQNTVIDDNSKQFYGFRTLEKTAETKDGQPKDAGTLLIENLTVPRYWNKVSIDIKGATKPFSSVSLFVNNMDIPRRSLSADEIGSSGKFAFAQVSLQQENTIKVSVTDKSGNKAEKIFQVSVDTETPAAKLNEIPALLPKTNFTVTGTVSEPTILSIFADFSQEGPVPPSKVTGLAATKVNQNSIELKWDESKDKSFSNYAIYRNGEPIAVTKPANYNFFIDALVDSGKQYKYEVSAVSLFGIEGPKSEPLNVRSLSGGQILNLKHPQVNIFEESEKPFMVLNVSNKLEFGMKLAKGDGVYRLRFIFEDKAGNKFLIEKITTLDTKRPIVKITSPQTGAFLYENIADGVDIVGKTEPNAKVHLFVNRLPFSVYEQSIEIAGIPGGSEGTKRADTEIDIKVLEDRIQNITEAELESKCPKSAAGRCIGADSFVIADDEGNFRFDKVDLTADFGAAARLRNVPVTDFRDTQLSQEAKGTKSTTFFVIATDKVGLRGAAKQIVSIGTCWSGNQSWSIIPITQKQTPTLISTERLAEGTEDLYFFFNYTYRGRGTNARISDVFISKACSRGEASDPRFNLSCAIMPSGGTSVKLNAPDNTLTYSAVHLSRIPNMDRFLENDWKSFFKAINNEMTFPFQVRIIYEHDIIDDRGESKRARETQTTCQEVTYVVDNTIIDPRKVLPGWLLTDFVDGLQKAVKVLAEVQEKIDRLVDYVGQACMGTFLVHTGYKVYRSYIDLSNQFQWNLKTFNFNTGDDQTNQECDAIAKAIEKKFGSKLMRYWSDPDLKKCFRNSYGAWQNEAKFYELQRFSCDRIFGHSSPSKWTEDKPDDKLQREIEKQKGCPGDNAVSGLGVTAHKCVEPIFANKYPGAKDLSLDSKCVELIAPNQLPALYLVDNVPVSAEHNLYSLRAFAASGGLAISDIKYAIKDPRAEDYYLTARPKTCKDICGADKTNVVKRRVTPFSQRQAQQQLAPNIKPAPPKLGECITAQTCTDIAADPEQKVLIDGQPHQVIGAFSAGYTSDCFYNPNDRSGLGLNNYNVISEDSDTERMECCCINSKGAVPEEFYQINDKSKYSNELIEKAPGSQVAVHESKSIADAAPQELSDIKWSYRYQRLKFEASGTSVQSGQQAIHNKYNPNRYMEGRDLPACFGQDSWLKKKETVVLNPQQQHLATLQCAYLTGINQRLQLMKNIMTSMSNCLIEVRETGGADAGVCKELFTQHVCGAIWQMIRFFIDGCNPGQFGVNADAREDSFADKLKLGFKGVQQGITEAQQEITEDYGNAKLDNLLGVGEGGIARKMCLAAFGYDWDLTAKNLVDAAYTSPFATLVQPVTRSREFLTVDPLSLRPRHEYRASWLINPGCDFDNYIVELACVSNKERSQYPNQINCGAQNSGSIAYVGQAPFAGPSSAYGNCDCLGKSEEQRITFWTGGRLKQSILEEQNPRRVIDSEYRYDHLKFTLIPDARITPNVRQNCFPTGFENGVFYRPIIDKTAREIIDCTVSPLSGVYSCGGSADFFSNRGTAQVIEVTVNDEKVFPERMHSMRIGDPLNVKVKVGKTGKDKCVQVSVTPDPIPPQIIPARINGESEVGIFPLGNLAVYGRSAGITSHGIVYKTISLYNRDIVQINVQFTDNKVNTKPGYKKENENKYSIDDTVIIDGHDIDLFNRKVSDTGDSDTAISVSDGAGADTRIIRIGRQDATIDIIDVPYSTAPESQGPRTIIINPLQAVAAQGQPKKLIVEIFNLKDDREAYGNVDDCNIADRVVGHTYNLDVGLKGVGSEQMIPIIATPQITPQNIVEGDTVTISARITHPSGIIDKSMLIVTKDGTQVKEEKMEPIDGVFTARISLPEGKYNAKITAVSRDNTENSRPFLLTVNPKRNP